MEIILKGSKIENEKEIVSKLNLRIEDGDMIFNIDGQDVFKTYCLDVLTAVRAFNI